MPSPTTPLNANVDAHHLVHSLVYTFLQRAGYSQTLSAFESEAASVSGWSPPNDLKRTSLHSAGPTAATTSDVDLRTLAEVYLSTQRAAASQRQAAALALQKSNTPPSPTDLVLSGPSALPYTVSHTLSTLHSSNILSLSLATLPSRSFDTSLAAYRNQLVPCLVSSSADKRIVFTRLSQHGTRGEVVESLEEDSLKAHSAAVLCTAQSPHFKGELVSSGMDARIVVWDLLSRQPIQTLSDHSKFVVRLAFSPAGRYLASASYDRTVRIYKRRHQSTSSTKEEEDDGEGEEEGDVGPPLPSRPNGFELYYTLPTEANPEAILFVRAPVPGLRRAGGAGQRTWLVYTVRGDCFLNYLLLPRDEEEDLAPQSDRVRESEGGEESGEMRDMEQRLEGLDVGKEQEGEEERKALRDGADEDWCLHRFNTNANKEDLHVSYSLLSLSLHPLGTHISVQTGDHSTPQVGHTSSTLPTISRILLLPLGHTSSTLPTISRILLLPLLSSTRSCVLWTSTPSSSYSIPRHAWTRGGEGVWCTSEEGLLRLVDMKGKVRAIVPCHGTAVEARRRARESRSRSGNGNGEEEEMRSAATWSRGGNTIIRDVVVLPCSSSEGEAEGDGDGDRDGDGDGWRGKADEELVASCGFDRTVRVLGFLEEGEEEGQEGKGVVGTI